MTIARITNTKTITSVVNGTGGKARFTHASNTTVPVGSTVTNAGFGVGGYNVTQVVTASTATYYELTIAYSANSSGTGTYYSYQQDNEVAKAITAIASVANGIQCTCVAHGYAVGDAVLIVGTIDYNGSWLISAVATDTFNIVSQYSDIDRVVALTFTSSQTGTVSRGDKNLAGLATLSGVSVVYYTIGSALETRAVYTLPAGSIFTFNGVCNWNPRYEEFIIPNSGQITVDFRITFAGFIKIGSYTKGVLRISGAYDVGFRLYETVQNSYNYSVRTTGTVWLMGGVYHLPGGGWDTLSGGIQRIRSVPRFIHHKSSAQPNAGPYSLGVKAGATIDSLGLAISHEGMIASSTTINMDPLATVVNFSGLDFSGYVSASYLSTPKTGATYAVPLVVSNIDVDSPRIMTGDNAVGWMINCGNVKGKHVRLFYRTGATAAYTGLVETYRDIVSLVKSASGTAIEGAKIYTRIIADNARKTSISFGQDYKIQREYTGLTNVSGVNTLRVLESAGCANYDLGAETQVNFDTEWFWNADASIPFIVVAYGYQAIFTSIAANVVGAVPAPNKLLADLGITQSTKAIVAAYTGFSAESILTAAITSEHTSSEVYDRRKYQESENPAWVWDTGGTMCFSAAGVQYDFNSSYVLTLQAVLSGKLITGAQLVLSTGWGITAPLSNVTLVFPAVGNYDLRSVALSGSSNLVNTSGGAVAVQLPIGAAYVNTGPNITVTRSAPVLITLPELVEGTRVRVYDTTNALELSNSLVVGAGGYTLPYTYTAPISILVYATYQNGTQAKKEIILFGNVSATGFSSPVEQEDDAVYVANGIDGSTVTEYTADFPHVQIDINDPDGRSQVQRLYAWYVAQCYTEVGIRNWIGAITAQDTLNYRINTGQVDLKLDNVGIPFVLYGGKLTRSDGTTIIGSGSIQIDWPDLFYLPPDRQALTKQDFIGLTLALGD